MERRNHPEANILMGIEEGMDVADISGTKVGTVKFVKFGEENSASPGAETVTGTEYEDDDSFIQDLVEAFVGDDTVPEAVEARLRRYGYVRIDTGLFSGDCFVMPEQIAGVSDNTVRLNIKSDDVMEI